MNNTPDLLYDRSFEHISRPTTVNELFYGDSEKVENLLIKSCSGQ